MATVVVKNEAWKWWMKWWNPKKIERYTGQEFLTYTWAGKEYPLDLSMFTKPSVVFLEIMEEQNKNELRAEESGK